MKGRPQKVVGAMREKIIEIGRKRRALRALPTNRELATEAGISVRSISALIHRELVRSKEVPPVTEADLDALAAELRKLDGCQ